MIMSALGLMGHLSGARLGWVPDAGDTAGVRVVLYKEWGVPGAQDPVSFVGGLDGTSRSTSSARMTATSCSMCH
jgi:hypothetical protein